jgi:hypothetical protein
MASTTGWPVFTAWVMASAIDGQWSVNHTLIVEGSDIGVVIDDDHSGLAGAGDRRAQVVLG